MSRLKKIAMDMNAFQGIINQTSNKGREILKSLEDFKFTLEQSARLLKNDQDITQGMIQKRKSLDEITAKLYQIVFDIENMDISMAFNNQNQPVVQDVPVGQPKPKQPTPVQQPGNADAENNPPTEQEPVEQQEEENDEEE